MKTGSAGGEATGPCEKALRSAGRLTARGLVQGALEKCTEALRQCPDDPRALRLRGTLLLVHGRAEDALHDLDRVVGMFPARAECWFEHGTANLYTGHLDEALGSFDHCLALAPDMAPALASRSLVLSRLQRHDEALRDITRAVELRPGNDADLHNQAVVLSAMDRYGEAIRGYERVLRLNPRSAGTHNNLAWLLATTSDAALRNGARAVEHARKALALGMNAAWMDTLAAALAETGDFEQAVLMQKRAYKLSQPKNETFRRRITVYRKRMTYATWWNNRSKEKTGANGERTN